MLYSRLVAFVAAQLWALEPNKLDEILAVLAISDGGRPAPRIGATRSASQTQET